MGGRLQRATVAPGRPSPPRHGSGPAQPLPLDQPSALQGRQHTGAASEGGKQILLGHRLLVGGQMGHHLPLALRQVGQSVGCGVRRIRQSQRQQLRLRRHRFPPSCGALAQPSRGQHTAQGAKKAGVGGLGHLSHQVLPTWIDGGGLQHRFDGLQDQLRQLTAEGGGEANDQAGVASPLEPNQHQVPKPKGPLLGVGIGEDSSLPTGLQPDLNPGRRRGGDRWCAHGRPSKSCKPLTPFLECCCWAVPQTAVGTRQSSVHQEVQRGPEAGFETLPRQRHRIAIPP